MKTLLMIVSVMVFSGCMIGGRQPIPQQTKDDFEWETLNLDDRLKVFAVTAPLRVLGTGTAEVEPDGSFRIDTSAKLRDILHSVNEGMQTAAGVAKTAAGAF